VSLSLPTAQPRRMARTPRPEPRKLPSQARSRALFDALLIASAELLERDGPDFALADVASRAGVSPGSLYQYFPDRAALVAALIDRQVASDREALEQWKSARRSAASSPELADALVSGVLGLYGERPALLSHMVQLLERVGRQGDVLALVSELCAELSRELHVAASERSLAECREATDAAVFGILAVVRQAAQNSPETLASPTFRARLSGMARAALDERR
jgi:AcrR family transcriptional regulator